MLEPDQWDSVLSTITGTVFRGTERVATRDILNALQVPQERELRQKLGKRLVTRMRALGWTGPRTMRIDAGVSKAGYWRLPMRPPGGRGDPAPLDDETLADDLPAALETVTRLGLRKMARVLRIPLEVDNGHLLRAQMTAATTAVNAQLRADEQRLRAKVTGDVLERLLAAIEKERRRLVPGEGRDEGAIELRPVEASKPREGG